MRTRKRTVVSNSWPSTPSGSINLTHYKCDGSIVTSTVADGAYAKYDNIYYIERISDSLGKGLPHNVIHRKSERVVRQIGSLKWNNLANPYGMFNYGTRHDTVMRYYSQISVGSFFSMDVDHSSSAPTGWNMGLPGTVDSIAINNLKDQARQLKADAVLNIVEASSTWDSFKQLTFCLPNMAKHWRKLTRRNLIATASSSFLAWKFGVGPIISDLDKLCKYGPDMERQYKRFVDGQKSRFSQIYRGNPTFSRPPVSATANGQVVDVRTYEGKLLAGPTVSYVLVVKPVGNKYLTDFFNRLSFLLQRFSSSPARLVWERIPLSFMLEWFVDVRSCLDGIDSLIGYEPYKIISLTKSTKWKVQTELAFSLRNICNGSAVWDGPFCSAVDSHYDRSVISPSKIPRWNPRFGKTQAGITAALISQQLAKTIR